MTFTNIDPFLASCSWGIREGLLNELLLPRLLARAPRLRASKILNILQSNGKTQAWMISKGRFKGKVSSFRAHPKHQRLSLINGKESSTSIRCPGILPDSIHPWVPTRGSLRHHQVVICHQSHLTETLHEFRAPLGNSCREAFHSSTTSITSPYTLHISSDLHDVRIISLPPKQVNPRSKSYSISSKSSCLAALLVNACREMVQSPWCQPTLQHDNSNDLHWPFGSSIPWQVENSFKMLGTEALKKRLQYWIQLRRRLNFMELSVLLHAMVMIWITAPWTTPPHPQVRRQWNPLQCELSWQISVPSMAGHLGRNQNHSTLTAHWAMDSPPWVWIGRLKVKKWGWHPNAEESSPTLWRKVWDTQWRRK